MKDRRRNNGKYREKNNAQSLPVLRKLTLNDLVESYLKNYRNFHKLINSKEPIQRMIKGQMYTSEAGVQLGLALQKNLQDSLDHGAELRKLNLFCQASVSLHIKMTILHAQLLAEINHSSIFRTCDNAVDFIKRFHHLLNYGNDVLFQQQAEILFAKYDIMFPASPEHAVVVNQIKTNVILIRDAFRKNYGNTIVKLQLSYRNFEALFIRNNSKLTIDLLNQREEFFTLVRDVESAIDNMKIEDQLPIEYQIYSFEKNLYMMTISELTHPRSLWKLFYMQGSKVCFMLNATDLNTADFKLYYNHWLTLKKDYIEPSFLFIKSLNIKGLILNIDLVPYLKPLLGKWLYVILRAIELFKFWSHDRLQEIELEKQLESKLWQEIKGIVLELDKEIIFLDEKLEILNSFAIQFNKNLSNNGFKIDEALPGQLKEVKAEIAKAKQTIPSLKSTIEIHEKAQTKQSKKTSERLLAVEQEEKAQSELKIRRRRQPLLQIIKSNYQSQEELSSEEEEVWTEALIDPTLEKLQKIDEEALLLARALKPKAIKLYTEFSERAAKEIAIYSNEQGRFFQEFTQVVVDYYHLVSLKKKHKAYSQLEEIKCQPDVREDLILEKRKELKETSFIIYKNIESIRTLKKEIDAKEKRGRDNRIRELGDQWAIDNNRSDASEEEKWTEGRILYKAIGRKKELQGKALSQHAQQKDFFELMELVFSTLNYLQDKIKPHIFDNYNECLNKFSLFQDGNSKHAQLSYGRFYGMLGIMLKNLFSIDRNITHLKEALTLISKAYDYFQKRKNFTALHNMAYQLAYIKDVFGHQDTINPDLINQSLKHYQDALTFNNKADLKMDLDRIEEIQLRINELEQKGLESAPLLITNSF